jgi:hypothetical protein
LKPRKHSENWFLEFDAEGWESRFEKDVAAGKFDALADEAIKDLREGRCSYLIENHPNETTYSA